MYRFTSGKYEGQTFGSISEEDKDYLIWWIRTLNKSEKLDAKRADLVEAFKEYFSLEEYKDYCQVQLSFAATNELSFIEVLETIEASEITLEALEEWQADFLSLKGIIQSAKKDVLLGRIPYTQIKTKLRMAINSKIEYYSKREEFYSKAVLADTILFYFEVANEL